MELIQRGACIWAEDTLLDVRELRFRTAVHSRAVCPRPVRSGSCSPWMGRCESPPPWPASLSFAWPTDSTRLAWTRSLGCPFE